MMQIDHSPNALAALAYARRGWPVFPVHSPAGDGGCSCGKAECTRQGKHPRIPGGRNKASTDERQVLAWWKKWPEANIGIATGDESGFWVLDVDGPEGQAAIAQLEAEHGELPPTLLGLTGGGGMHYLFAMPAGVYIPTLTNNPMRKVDTRGRGGYIVAPPSLHASGRRYEWAADADAPPAEAPAWLVALVRREDADEAPRPVPAAPEPFDGDERARKYGLAALDSEGRELAETQEGGRNDRLNKAAMKMGGLSAACGITEAMAEAVLIDAALKTGLARKEAMATYRSGWKAGVKKPRQIPEAQLRRQRPPTGGDRPQPAPSTTAAVGAQDKPREGKSPADVATTPHEGDRLETAETLEGYDLEDEDLTELGMAIRFARLNRDRVRFAHGIGWLTWDGTRFVDDAGAVQELVTAQVLALRPAAAELRKEAGSVRAQAALLDEFDPVASKLTDKAKGLDKKAASLLKAIKELGRHSKIRGIMAQAESKPGIRCRVSDFDQDPWLLNVRNGVVNLKTGALLPHSPGLMLTRTAGANFDAEATSPRWERFVHDAFNGDEEMIRFVRQIIGYTLTGDVREQKFFIFEGLGGNGKGVFLDTVIALLGDYARTVRKELITLRVNGDSQGDADLATLPGARIASVNELSDGDRLNVSRVKEMTGGEELTANPKYLKPFTFTSCAKLYIRTNHLPDAKVDQALADRLVRVPFRARFRGTDKEDKDLKNKLIEELPGILNWAIQGARDWLQHGLIVPQVVVQASAEYVAEQDPIGSWIEQLELRPLMESSRLQELYVAWCEDEGVPPVSPESLGKALTKRGWGSKNTRLSSGGKKVRVRIPPDELMAASPVPLSQAVPDKIVSLPGLAQYGTAGTDFSPKINNLKKDKDHEGKLGGGGVPTRTSRPTGTESASPATAYEEGHL